MEKKQITIDSPVTVSGLTITPVTEIATYSWLNKVRLSFFGLKKPLYILISDRQSAIKVFTVSGQESSLEQIISDYPMLRESIKTGLDIVKS